MSSVGLAIDGLCERPVAISQVAELYEAHRDGIYRFLVCQGVSPGEAQEVTQDAFVDLHRALLKGIMIHSPEAWLYTVASRSACDYWRRNHKRLQVSIPADAESSLQLAAKEPSPEAVAHKRQRLRRMAVGLSKLPVEQQLCLQLRMKGLRYREISKALDTPISTVADRLTAAVAFLRRECE